MLTIDYWYSNHENEYPAQFLCIGNERGDKLSELVYLCYDRGREKGSQMFEDCNTKRP